MANVDNPYGFRPWGPVLSIKRFQKDSSASRTYRWDVIQMSSDGNVDPATAGNTVLVGTAAHPSAASTAENLMVYDDMDQKFECQDDGSATLAQTNVGNLADHVAGSGSTVTNISGHELNASGTGTTTAGFLLLDLVNRPGNAFGANGDYVVLLNEHIGRGGGAGV